ncbi:MAG: hypothetical protein M1831_006789 [Alyxoria varia]|nr:MAG: hypothetical protein M1831_006789 [Alyxoria varia]
MIRCVAAIAVGTLLPFSTAAPHPQAAVVDGVPWKPSDDTWQIQINKRCSAEQYQAISLAWKEAGYLANAMKQWNPGNTFQNAMDLYMGDQSDEDGGFFGEEHQYTIQKAIHNEFTLHNGAFQFATAYFYCDEDEYVDQTGEPAVCGGETVGYSWSAIGTVWQTHYVVLCPFFFSLSSLQQLVRYGKLMKYKQSDSYLLYSSKAHTVFHESLHWYKTVSDPRIEDDGLGPNQGPRPVYGPKEVKKEAEEKNAASTTAIADAFSVAADAIYQMITFKLDEPPQPANSDAETAGQASYPDQPAKFVVKEAPTNFVAPQDLDDPESKPDGTQFTPSDNTPLDDSIYGPVS